MRKIILHLVTENDKLVNMMRREGQAADPTITIERVKSNFFQDLLNSKRETGAGLVVKSYLLSSSPAVNVLG